MLLNSEDRRLVYQIPLRQIGDIRAKYRAGKQDFRWADLRGAKLSPGWAQACNLRGAILPD